MFHVYLMIKNVKNFSINRDTFYVGVTKRLNKRIYEHNKERHNTNKKDIMNRYGYIVLSLWQVPSLEEAFEREKFLISYFGRIINGGQLANSSPGGEGLSIWAKENRNIYIEKSLLIPMEDIQKYIEQYKSFHGTIKEFAKSIGFKRETVNRWLLAYGNIARKYKKLSQLDKDGIIKDASNGMSPTNLAIKYEFTQQSIRRWIKEWLGIDSNEVRHNKKLKIQYIIMSNYELGFSREEICSKYNISLNIINKTISKMKAENEH